MPALWFNKSDLWVVFIHTWQEKGGKLEKSVPCVMNTQNQGPVTRGWVIRVIIGTHMMKMEDIYWRNFIVKGFIKIVWAVRRVSTWCTMTSFQHPRAPSKIMTSIKKLLEKPHALLYLWSLLWQLLFFHYNLMQFEIQSRQITRKINYSRRLCHSWTTNLLLTFVFWCVFSLGDAMHMIYHSSGLQSVVITSSCQVFTTVSDRWPCSWRLNLIRGKTILQNMHISNYIYEIDGVTPRYLTAMYVIYQWRKTNELLFSVIVCLHVTC